MVGASGTLDVYGTGAASTGRLALASDYSTQAKASSSAAQATASATDDTARVSLTNTAGVESKTMNADATLAASAIADGHAALVTADSAATAANAAAPGTRVQLTGRATGAGPSTVQSQAQQTTNVDGAAKAATADTLVKATGTHSDASSTLQLTSAGADLRSVSCR